MVLDHVSVGLCAHTCIPFPPVFAVKDVIPLGSPRPEPSSALSSIQETEMEPSQPPGHLSNPNTYPLPKPRAKPAPGLPPHPPHLPGVHHRASRVGVGGEAKDGPANFTNTLIMKTQHSHSPVTPDPYRGKHFNTWGGMGRDNPLSPSSLPPCRVSAPSRRGDYGVVLREDMNKKLKSRGSLDHRGATPSNKQFTKGGTRSMSLKRLRHPDLEERNRGRGEDMANKRLHPEDYIPDPISTCYPPDGTASSKMSTSPNPSYLKKVFMKNNLSSSPSLRLKESFTPKKTEEGMERDMSNFPTYPLSTPKPARKRCTGHGKTPCCNNVRENGNPQAGYRGMNHQSGNPANLPVTILSRGECSRAKETRERESGGREPTVRPDGRTPKPDSKSQSSESNCPSSRCHQALEKKRHVSRPRRTSALPDDLNDLFTPDPITSSLSRAVMTFSPSPQRGDRSPSVHNKVPLSVVLATVSDASMGPGSPYVTSPREIPPKSRSQRIPCPKISSCTDTATDPCKLLLDPKIYSSFVRLELSRNDLTKLETGLYRAITSTVSSSGKPSSPKDVTSGPKTRSSGIASAELVSTMNEDENAYLKTESSVLKTIPLSVSAKSSSSWKDKSFSMETADLKTSPFSTLDQHGQGKKGEERKGGDQKVHKSLSFLKEGEQRSNKNNSRKSLEGDPVDVELSLGLDLSLGLELALSQTSSSSDEDQLPSLQQILYRTAWPPDTPEKGTIPAPSIPVGLPHHSQPPSSSKATSYRNNLDEMLKEKEGIQRSKEMEAKLHLSCKEKLLRLAEEEEEENIEEAISQQQKDFLQRFSVLSSAIQDLHPGEAVFNLDNFGRLFSQHTLQLRRCNVTPCDTTQKTILCSSPDQFRTQVSSQLFQRAYCSSPCPPQVTRWLFQLPRICMSLIALTEDHHNLRWLVELLPDSMRGKQLRRHLSVSAISKLLNNRCTYIPSNTEFQLSDLRPYLSQMRPSSLLRGLATSCYRRSHHPHREREEEEDCASLDQQAYYLCYSLLALANEATNFEFFPSEQKNQLLLLSAELEKHIKSDIRESEKMLYRSRVKDLVARIYTKWHALVQRTRPLQDKLYDFWQPPPEDAVSSSQESQHSHRESDGEEEREGDRVMEVEGEEDEGDKVRIAVKTLAMEDESDEKEKTPEKLIVMEEAEEEKDIQGEEEDTFLKMEEMVELTLEDSDEEPDMEDMVAERTEVELRVTEKREAPVEERREEQTEGRD
uniref:Coiled-coil SMC6 And NSE5 INteracting (CANIN) domain-containing protein n=1 Tax=Oncorhynchus mykiss TaxID=8022 RepID=A0A8K9WWZ6_ONCMY